MLECAMRWGGSHRELKAKPRVQHSHFECVSVETYRVNLAFGILAHRKKYYLHVRTRPLGRKFHADSENGLKKFRTAVESSKFWTVCIKFDIPPALRKNSPKFID